MKKQNDNALLTVFTPAYNRAHTLGRTYESLCAQTCKDFLWLIVDDGSTDNTAELVKNWQQCENGFEIRYVYKDNGGMHTAHNTAYELIDTELNVCIDSDDALAEDAVSLIREKWTEVRDCGYAGIIGLDADFSGKIIGKGFPENQKETSLIDYYLKGGSGDKKLVYRTDVINRYPPYPVFPGEKYYSLSYKYRLVDQEYKMAVLNRVLCRVEYQQDGSTHTMLKQYVLNPKGFAHWRKFCMDLPVGKKRLFEICTHYVSSSLFAGDYGFLFHSPRKVMTLLAVIPGIALNCYIRYNTRE